MKWIVIDINTTCWGPFEKATEAADWATKKWPHHEAPNDDPGWQVKPLREPEL